MENNKIIVHFLVKNEENFVWYALNSVLPHVDKVMVWDTGSEDKTVEIIKSINSPKIEFQEKGTVDANSFTDIRNQMLKETDKDKFGWLMILDGDEIWPNSSLLEVEKYLASHTQTQAVFVNTWNMVGDIFHKQPKSAGHYHIKGKTGHLSLRFINLRQVPNLKVDLPHGQQGYFSNNTLIQELPRVDYLNTYYIHTTHLRRSSLDNSTLKRSLKRKYELGDKVDRKALPDVFFVKRPAIVPDVTHRMDLLTFLKSLILTIPRRLRRKLITLKEGY